MCDCEYIEILKICVIVIFVNVVEKRKRKRKENIGKKEMWPRMAGECDGR
jgi:hypothetical protein